jgi:hypothetical protein
MKVLLLGAGASKAYEARGTDVRMPLARDFLQTFHKLPISANPWVLVGNVLHYARIHRNLSPEQLFAAEIDIEDLHSEVETRMLGELMKCQTLRQLNPEAIQLHGVYVQLVCLFACTINEIQKANISTAHVNLAKTLSPSDTVITFNWDTLMDRALHELGAWQTDFGYGITPHRIFRNGWETPKSDAGPRCVQLLKLHGSTNWITSYLGIDHFVLSPMQSESPDRLYVYEHTGSAYPTYAGRFMAGYADFSYGYYPPNLQDDSGKAAPDGHVYFSIRPKSALTPEGTANDSGLVSMPLIIPPVKRKSYTLYGDLFTNIWEKAKAALISADQIAIVGYSFPRTDHQSIALFKSAFVKRATIPKIVIVNPEPARIRSLIERDFGIPPRNVKEIRELFSSSFDCSRLWDGRS